MRVVSHERTANRLTSAELRTWQDVPVSIIVDLEPDRQIDNRIRPLIAGSAPLRLNGPAMTVKCSPPDFGAVVLALDHIRKGDVLVVSASGNLDVAMVGEILGGHLRTIGCAGIVVDGVIRDIDMLGSWPDFPVFARGINPRGPSSAAEGDINCDVNLGGCEISSGDLVIGDRDGLVVLPPDIARARSQDAANKLAQEKLWIEGLKADRPITEVFGQ